MDSNSQILDAQHTEIHIQFSLNNGISIFFSIIDQLQHFLLKYMPNVSGHKG